MQNVSHGPRMLEVSVEGIRLSKDKMTVVKLVLLRNQ